MRLCLQVTGVDRLVDVEVVGEDQEEVIGVDSRTSNTSSLRQPNIDKQQLSILTNNATSSIQVKYIIPKLQTS